MDHIKKKRLRSSIRIKELMARAYHLRLERRAHCLMTLVENKILREYSPVFIGFKIYTSVILQSLLCRYFTPVGVNTTSRPRFLRKCVDAPYADCSRFL
jgi:hypothetical protein